MLEKQEDRHPKGCFAALKKEAGCTLPLLGNEHIANHFYIAWLNDNVHSI